MTIWQYILYALLAFVAHELGHISAADLFGMPVKKVGVSWRGVYIQRARTTGLDEIMICLAGPYVNLLFALAFCEFHWFALCNLIFAVVNLVPLGSSDGAHALEEWRAMRWRNYVERLRRNMP